MTCHPHSSRCLINDQSRIWLRNPRQHIHDSHIFSNVDLEVKILEHIDSASRRVAERDVLESKGPSTRRVQYHTHARLDRRSSVEELKNTRPSADSAHYRCLRCTGYTCRNRVKGRLTKKDLESV